MKFQFLGTSSGIPTKERNLSALALNLEGQTPWFLVDCGEGTQQQLLRSSYSLSKLAAIFITHVHGDHCFGLPGLLASAAMQGRRQPLSVIAPHALQAALTLLLHSTQTHLEYELKFIALEDFTGVWQGGGLEVRAYPLSHRVPCYAYRFCEMPGRQRLDSDKLKAAGVPTGVLWGQLQQGQDILLEGRLLRAVDYLQEPWTARCVVVAGDNDRPELLREACSGAQVLVHEATYSQQQKAAARLYQHCDTETIARFAAQQQIPNLVLTHFSSRYNNNPQSPPSLQTLEQEARKYFAGGLFLARDFARYSLDHHARLKPEQTLG